MKPWYLQKLLSCNTRSFFKNYCISKLDEMIQFSKTSRKMVLLMQLTATHQGTECQQKTRSKRSYQPHADRCMLLPFAVLVWSMREFDIHRRKRKNLVKLIWSKSNLHSWRRAQYHDENTVAFHWQQNWQLRLYWNFIWEQIKSYLDILNYCSSIPSSSKQVAVHLFSSELENSRQVKIDYCGRIKRKRHSSRLCFKTKISEEIHQLFAVLE